MTIGRVAMLVGIALLVMVANVAISILYMVVYGHVIDPGHEKEYYQEHVQIAAPYSSIIAGIPLMFLAGWWMGGSREYGVLSALIIWVTYAAIDLAVLGATGVTARLSVIVAISLLTKLAAAYCGAFVAGRGTPA